MSNTARLMVIAFAMLAAYTPGTAAEAAAEIPARFHGAGCNLKYTYVRTPQDLAGCVNAKDGHQEGDGHDNDNFIRITADSVAGVEWSCTVKEVKAVSEAEITFAGNCGGEGVDFASTVTLLLRPGNRIIVDQSIDGRHIIDIYRLRAAD